MFAVRVNTGKASCGINPFTIRHPLEIIVCYSHTCENNWLMFITYLEERCSLTSD